MQKCYLGGLLPKSSFRIVKSGAVWQLTGRQYKGSYYYYQAKSLVSNRFRYFPSKEVVMPLSQSMVAPDAQFVL